MDGSRPGCGAPPTSPDGRPADRTGVRIPDSGRRRNSPGRDGRVCPSGAWGRPSHLPSPATGHNGDRTTRPRKRATPIPEADRRHYGAQDRARGGSLHDRDPRRHTAESRARGGAARWSASPGCRTDSVETGAYAATGRRGPSARRRAVSGLTRGSGRPLRTRISLVPLWARYTAGAGIPSRTPEAGRSRCAGIALVTLRSGWTDRADLSSIPLQPRKSMRPRVALLALGPRQPLRAGSARRSSWAFRPRLALQVGQLSGQFAQLSLEPIQTIRRCRLAGRGGFGGAHPLGRTGRGFSCGCFLDRTFRHSSLLR
jgi:hypothetical protein